MADLVSEALEAGAVALVRQELWVIVLFGGNRLYCS